MCNTLWFNETISLSQLEFPGKFCFPGIGTIPFSRSLPFLSVQKAWGRAVILDLAGKIHSLKLADLKLKEGYVFDGFFTQLYHLWTIYLALDFWKQKKTLFGQAIVVMFQLSLKKSWFLQCALRHCYIESGLQEDVPALCPCRGNSAKKKPRCDLESLCLLS